MESQFLSVQRTPKTTLIDAYEIESAWSCIGYRDFWYTKEEFKDCLEKASQGLRL